MEYLKDLVLYDAWANRMVLRALDGLPAVDERTFFLLSHLGAAKRIWADRIQGRDTTGQAVWPQLPVVMTKEHLVEAATTIAKADAAFMTIVLKGEMDPSRVVNFKTTTGEAMSSTVAEIIVHTVNHGTYHRGQIATATKKAGGTPASTDFIVWCRQGRPMAV